MFKRLKYISRSARPWSTEEITRLAERSAEKNRREEITGILIETGGIFFQVIEGPAAAVDGLYEKIVADPRHEELLLLNVMADAPDRLFPDWAMKTVQIDADDLRRDAIKLLLETAVEAHHRVERLTAGIERVVWGEATTPVTKRP